MSENRRIGQIRVTFPNLPTGGSACRVGGELANEFERLTNYLQDLVTAKDFSDLTLTINDPHLLEAVRVAALIRFMRCFESTSGLRVKPLKISKVFNKTDREFMKILVRTRNKFVVHDEQTHPMMQTVVLLDAHGTAIDVVAASGVKNFTNFGIADDMPRLIEIALDFVRQAHLNVGQSIMAECNARNSDEKLATKGANEILIDVLREDDDETNKEPGAFDQVVEYLISDQALQK